MRLSVSSPQFQTLLAIPFLVAMLAFPASAEPNPKAGPSTPSATKTESTADTTPPADAKPEEPRLDAATSEDDSAAPADDAKSEEADPSADAAAIETPKSTVLVDIDKSTQEMTVFVDGIEQYRWPVSTGTRGYSTPSGTYTASSMNEIWYSRQWDNAPMPHAIFFTKKGHAIHGTTEEKNLGNAASHGCVRLSRANAKTLFQLVKETGLENTQVVLTGETKGGEGPKVATTGSRRQDAYPPWFAPGYGYYPPGQRKKRRGLFGRRWFQPDTQGYYQAPRRRY
ncbi:MAG TPA: L,D-transpeptidase family protein [Methyloceanibacter sp.]|nr:L,D-transpeptidase family protein [Methyloceanibacter sp.]